MALKEGYQSAGFTVVEVMVILVISTILIVGAMPALEGIRSRSALTSVTNDLLGALYLARSEAIVRARRITLCPLGPSSTCLRGNGYQTGWLVFVDQDEDGERDEDELVLSTTGYKESALKVTGNGAVSNYVSYMPTGETRQLGGALQMGTVLACKNGAGIAIIIAATGRARSERRAECPDV